MPYYVYIGLLDTALDIHHWEFSKCRALKYAIHIILMDTALGIHYWDFSKYRDLKYYVMHIGLNLHHKSVTKRLQLQ